jgi:hypothetical protein
VRGRNGKTKSNSKKKAKDVRRMVSKKKSTNKKSNSKIKSAGRNVNNSKKRRKTIELFLAKDFEELFLQDELKNDLIQISGEYPRTIKEDIYSRVLKRNLQIYREEYYFDAKNYINISDVRNNSDKIYRKIIKIAVKFYKIIKPSYEDKYLIKVKYLFDLNDTTFESYYGGDITVIKNDDQFKKTVKRIMKNFQKQISESYLSRKNFSNMRVIGILVQGYK